MLWKLASLEKFVKTVQVTTVLSTISLSSDENTFCAPQIRDLIQLFIFFSVSL